MTSNSKTKLKEYIRAEEAWIKKFNVKAGTKVLVLEGAENGEMGWNNSWEDEMNKNIRRILTVVDAKSWDVGEGIILSDGYRYPYFCLKVKESI